MCHYTTLWNVSVLRITIKNKMTFVTTHFKKLTTGTTCLLSQLLSINHVFTVFTSNFQCVRLAAVVWWCDVSRWWSLSLNRCISLSRCMSRITVAFTMSSFCCTACNHCMAMSALHLISTLSFNLLRNLSSSTPATRPSGTIGQLIDRSPI